MDSIQTCDVIFLCYNIRTNPVTKNWVCYLLCHYSVEWVNAFVALGMGVYFTQAPTRKQLGKIRKNVTGIVQFLFKQEHQTYLKCMIDERRCLNRYYMTILKDLRTTLRCDPSSLNPSSATFSSFSSSQLPQQPPPPPEASPCTPDIQQALLMLTHSPDCLPRVWQTGITDVQFMQLFTGCTLHSDWCLTLDEAFYSVILLTHLTKT